LNAWTTSGDGNSESVAVLARFCVTFRGKPGALFRLHSNELDTLSPVERVNQSSVGGAIDTEAMCTSCLSNSAYDVICKEH